MTANSSRICAVNRKNDDDDDDDDAVDNEAVNDDDDNNEDENDNHVTICYLWNVPAFPPHIKDKDDIPITRVDDDDDDDNDDDIIKSNRRIVGIKNVVLMLSLV